MDKFREIINGLLAAQESHSGVPGTGETEEVEHSATPVDASKPDLFYYEDISDNSLDFDVDVETKVKVRSQCQNESGGSSNMRIKYSRDLLFTIRSRHKYSGFDPAKHGFPSIVRDAISNSKAHDPSKPPRSFALNINKIKKKARRKQSVSCDTATNSDATRRVEATPQPLVLNSLPSSTTIKKTALQSTSLNLCEEIRIPPPPLNELDDQKELNEENQQHGQIPSEIEEGELRDEDNDSMVADSGTATDEQCDPLSAKKRIKYDIDTLLLIRNQHKYDDFKPADRGFPNLVKDTVNNHVKSHGPLMNKNSPGGPRDYGRSRGGMPNQNKGLMMPPALSHMRNVMGGPMQWGGIGMMIPPAPPTRAQPKVQLTLQREEVKLHKAENAWKPSTLNKRDSHGDQALGEEQIVIESIEKETRAILNKLTPDNFDKLVENFSQLPFEGIDGRIAGIAGMLYEKAMSSSSQEISLLALYARMVSAICSTSEKNSKQFRKHVINICQSEFEVGIPAQLKSVEASLAKAPDNKILMESKKEFRSRKFCNIRFIGELFKLDMLPSSSMMHCVQLLLRSLDEDNLDSVCKLLTCVGERLDVQIESLEKLGNSKLVSETTSMNSVFQQLEDLLLISERIKLSPRIQFAILDVVELRKNGWKPARRSDNHEVSQKQDVCQRKDSGVNLPPVQNSGDGGSQVNGGVRVNGKSHRLELLDSQTQKNREGKGILGDIGEGEGKQTLEKTESLVTSYMKSSIAEKTGQVAKVIKVVFQNAIPSQEPAAYANLLHAAYKASQCNSKQFKKGIEKQCKNELQNSMHLYENRGIRVGRFIGELYNMDILSGEFVRVIVPTLLEVKVISGKEVYLETICGILISCGKNLDKDCRSKWMNNRIRLLEELSSSRLELSPTLRSEVLKILELRKNGWKSENMSGMNIKQHENVVPEGQENYLKKERSSDQDTLIGKSQSDRANGVHTNSLTPNEAVPKEVIPETINELDLSRSGTGTPGNRGDSAIKGKLIHTNLDLKCPFPPKSGQMTDLINEIFVDAVASSEPVTYAKMVHAVCQTSSQENCKQFKNEIALKCRHELYYSRHLRSNQKVKILRFIGELYNWNILIPEFVVGCVQSLLNPISESNLECLCEIVTICGKKLDTEVSLSRWMDARFVHLMELVDRKKVSPPVCSAIRSVIELRENQWKTQRNKDRNRTKKRGVVLGITGYPAYCWKK